MAFLAGIVLAAALHLNHDDVTDGMVVLTSGLGIEIDSPYFE
jgi:hypothetical protein